jgi:hypothetical protein
MAMQPKSVILPVATLVVGFALGLFVDARLIRLRRRPPIDRRTSPLATLIDYSIKPHSEAQRDSIDAVVQRFSSDNAATMSAAVKQTRAHTDSLRIVLAPILDSVQRVQLDSVLKTAARPAIARGFVRDSSNLSSRRR